MSGPVQCHEEQLCVLCVLLSQPNLTVAVIKQCIGTHQHKLLTANISAIFLPNELNIFGNSPTISRPQKKFKPVYPVFLVTAIS